MTDVPSEADWLILEAATGTRLLSEDELGQVVAHVAEAGFSPQGRVPVRGNIVGRAWQGRVLQRGDWLPAAEYHYLKHVRVQQEWPAGTTFAAFLASLRAVVLDPASGVLVSQYRDRGWHLAVVRQSGPLRGAGGYEWVMVEYRVGAGFWITAFQLEDGLAHFQRSARRDIRWLRRPQ